MAYEVATTKLRRCTLITIGGRFDSTTYVALERALQGAIKDKSFRIVLVMADVVFFSSSALNVLLRAVKQCRRYNRGDIRLSELPIRIFKVLELSGTLDVFDVFDTDAEAVGSY